MSGYIGTKSVTLSTTSANVGGDSTVGGDLTVDTNTLYVDSTNNRVGVGTASPSNPFQVGTSDLIVDSSGNVGIGTSSPLGKVTIANAAGANAPTSVTAANTYLQLGSDEFGPSNNGKFMIGFGYTDATNTNAPAYLGYEEVSTSGDTYGDLTFYTRNVTTDTAPSERMRIDSSGNLLVGTTSVFVGSGITPRLTVQKSGGSSIGANGIGASEVGLGTRPSANHTYYAGFFLNSSGTGVGSISVTPSSTAYNTSSDHRLKENVTDVTDGITRVKQLEPKRFNFIADADTTVDGFLAHQAQSVVPEAVTGTHNEVDADGNAVMQGIDQSKLVPLLTAALKEAITKIETLETEMTSVKARLDALEGN